MATKIQLRRDTAANWASENPILASGEMGIETDTFKFKIGDATTAWNSLQYASSTYTDSDVDTHLNYSTAANGQFLSWNGTDYAWDSVTSVSGFAIDTVTIEPTVIPNSVGVAIGSSATATGDSGPVAIGSYAAATDASAISIGNSSSSGGQQSISIGANATCGAGGDKGIAIGFLANASGFGGVGIGQSANGGVNGVALGRNATNSLGSGIAIGFGASAGDGEIKIISSKSKIEYTAANGFVFTEDVGGTNTTYQLSSLGTSTLEKQYSYQGALETNVSTFRLYLPNDVTSTSIAAYLGTASSSGTVDLSFKINGSTDTTFSIAESATSATATSSTAISAGGYVTIDITGAGTGASDLYVLLSFAG